MEVTAACRDTKLEKSTHLPLWDYHPCCGWPPLLWITSLVVDSTFGVDYLPCCGLLPFLWITFLVVDYHPCWDYHPFCGLPPLFSTTLSVFLFVKKYVRQLPQPPFTYSPATIIEKVNFWSLAWCSDAATRCMGDLARLHQPGLVLRASHTSRGEMYNLTHPGEMHNWTWKGKAELHKYVWFEPTSFSKNSQALQRGPIQRIGHNGPGLSYFWLKLIKH